MAAAPVYAKMIPLGASAARFIQINSTVTIFGGHHATERKGAVLHRLGPADSSQTLCLFTINYNAAKGVFYAVKEAGSVSLMLSHAEGQWADSLSSPEPLVLSHGCIIHVDGASFIARWRWIQQPSSSSLLAIQTFNSRQSIHHVLDDAVLAHTTSMVNSGAGSQQQEDSMAPPAAKKRKLGDKPEQHVCQSIDDVPRDASSGSPILPLHVTGGVTLLDLGQVDHTHDKFHNTRYIFPVGFKSRRMYASLVDPARRCGYTQEIRSTSTKTKQGHDSQEPVFVLICEEAPEQVLSSSTPSGVWAMLLERVKAHREEKAGKKLSTNISGQEQFGLSNAVIKSLIEELPNATLCKKYWEAKQPAAADASSAGPANTMDS